MARRRRNREADRWEAVVKGVGGLLLLIAIAVGGIKNFVPVLIGLVWVLGLAALVALAVFLGFRWYRRRKQERSIFEDFDFGTKPSTSVPPAAQAFTPVQVRPMPKAPSPVPMSWSGLKIVEGLSEIDWYQFEKFCAAVLRAEGFTVERKGGAQPDGGVDLVATKDGQAMLVQCKHWRTWTVQEKVIRELLGSMTHYRVRGGALYTLKGATRPAEAFALQHGIQVVDARALSARAKANLSEAQLAALLESREHHCPKCESPMVWRTGSFDPFWGCSTYPRCRGVLKHSGAR